MPHAPAICPKCGTIFASLINIKAANTTLTNIGVMCPKCGSEAQIPSGVYSALNATTLALTSGRISPEQLRKLIEIFESARSTQAAPEDVAKEIESNVPELATLSDVWPRTRPQLYAFVSVLIAALTFILETCESAGDGPGISESEVQQIVDDAIDSLF